MDKVNETPANNQIPADDNTPANTVAVVEAGSDKEQTEGAVGTTQKKEATNFENLTNDELGALVETEVRDTAENIWTIGLAVNIVKERTDHGGFEAWCKKYVPVPKVTLYRWRKVAQLSLEKVRGMKVTDLYRVLGLVPEKGDGKPGVKLNEVSVPAGYKDKRDQAAKLAKDQPDEVDALDRALAELAAVAGVKLPKVEEVLALVLCYGVSPKEKAPKAKGKKAQKAKGKPKVKVVG